MRQSKHYKRFSFIANRGEALSAYVSRCSGWRAGLMSYLAGALMAFGFAPYYYWPVLWVSLPVFYLLLAGAPDRRAGGWRGFFFGYGYFMAGTWWIANSMLVDAEKFAWMMPFSILGLSAVLALYFALLGCMAVLLRSASPLQNIRRFVVIWVVAEYVRSIGMFGFAWNLAGYVALTSVTLSQFASIAGVFGLSILVISVGTLPVLMVIGTSRRERRIGFVAPLIILALLFAYGSFRLPPAIDESKWVVRLVQPSIPQAIKHTPEGEIKALQILLALSAKPGGESPPDITVWPETAYPRAIRGTASHRAWPYSKFLLTGAVTVEEEGDFRIYNSIVVLDSAGALRARYDKHQLVPFGEFVPLRTLLPVNKITPGDIDFSRGPGPQTLRLPELPAFSPLVCYEVVFPWMAVDTDRRPDWIVNVTNDAWYGDSPGPYQHFAMAEMRAIEQGLPLVRSANNGISAMIDPYGRPVARLALDARDAVDAYLPKSLPPTMYARYGEKLTILWLLILWIATYLPQWRGKK